MDKWYTNEETGEVVRVPGDAEHRNASSAPRTRVPPQRRPEIYRPFNPGGHPGLIVRPPPAPPIRPAPQPAPQTTPEVGDDFVAIKKSAVAELLASVGPLWASVLARPQAPQAVGDDIIDRDNATMHRDALALHQQNQTRILALTDLAARAVKLFIK